MEAMERSEARYQHIHRSSFYTLIWLASAGWKPPGTELLECARDRDGSDINKEPFLISLQGHFFLAHFWSCPKSPQRSAQPLGCRFDILFRVVRRSAHCLL